MAGPKDPNFQEDTYFHRKNREALDRLAKRKEEPKRRLSPITGEPMVEEVLHGVVIDRCPSSGGIWLDAGELQQLLEAAVAAERESVTISKFVKSWLGIEKPK